MVLQLVKELFTNGFKWRRLVTEWCRWCLMASNGVDGVDGV
jgi:hypothetical protein